MIRLTRVLLEVIVVSSLDNGPADGHLPRIVFLHPSDELYGADRQLLALVRTASHVAHPVVLLPNDVAAGGALSRQLRSEGIEVRNGPLPVFRRRYARWRSFPIWLIGAIRGTWWTVRLARRERATVIVSNSTAVPIGPVVARLLRMPHIWFVREFIERPPWFRGLIRVLAKLAPGTVLAVSDAVGAWIGPISGRGPITMHDGVACSSEGTQFGSTPTAVFVGRLNEWKGWDTFVRAAALAHDEVPSSRFVIAGGVVENDWGAKRAAKAVIAAADPSGSWLTWVGEVQDSRTIMREAWVVVVPSNRPDPFPNVVLEAMAEGRAVIGSRSGGIPEMVLDGETGLLVEPGDDVALATAMTTVLLDRSTAQQMGSAGFERMRAEFSAEAFSVKWQAALEHAMSRAR